MSFFMMLFSRNGGSKLIICNLLLSHQVQAVKKNDLGSVHAWVACTLLPFITSYSLPLTRLKYFTLVVTYSLKLHTIGCH
mmetsp:Transcript_7277/g.10166  ORF Transcript_7277/g.10166 Transcript_7277/m.10166 type:complete len:80 (-) Transcript_7277:17-256(-)